MPSLPITIARVAPITNTVLSYDGIQQYAQEHAQILPPLTTFSIEAWVKVAGIPGTDWVNPAATLMQNSTDNSFWLGFFPVVTPEQKMATLYIGNSSQQKSFPYLFALGQWYYVVVTINLTTGSASLYVNASFANTITGALTGILTLGPLRIGGSTANTNTFFQGEIGTIRIWEGTLDQNNIKRLMYLTLSGTFQARDANGNIIATLLANWRCDEGYGGIAFDYSGPELNLILGDDLPGKKPVWGVSTIFKPPDFISAPAVIALTKDEGEVPVNLLSHAPFPISEKDFAEPSQRKESPGKRPRKAIPKLSKAGRQQKS